MSLPGSSQRSGWGSGPEEFRGKVVAITGAGKGSGAGGIGYAIARAYAELGARVAMLVRQEFKAKKTLEDIRGTGGEGLYTVGDVADDEAIERFFVDIEKNYGRLDIVINNAGVSGDVRALCRIPTGRWRYTFNKHLHPMGVIRRAAPLMKRSGSQGVIINVATYFTSPHRQVVHPYPFRTHYTGSQAWKIEFTRLAAWELAESGIAVLGVIPGPVQGERLEEVVYPLGAMERGLWGRRIRTEEVRLRSAGTQPGGRFLTPQEVARSIVTLSSQEMKAATNGALLEFAGGQEFRVSPRVAPGVVAGRVPDLTGRRVVLTGTADPERMGFLALGFAAAGAQVLLGHYHGSGVFSQLASGRSVERWGAGERALLSRIQPVDIDLREESQVAGFFQRAVGVDGFSGMDVYLHATGERPLRTPFVSLPVRELEALKEQFAFVPALVAKYACTAMLMEGARRAGIGDPRYRDMGSLVALLERERGVLGPHGTLERRSGHFTPEEEQHLQAAARETRCSLMVVGPDTVGPDEASLRRLDVLRSSLQAVISSLALEVGTARSRVTANLIFPGRVSHPGDPRKTNRLALFLASDDAADLSGMVYHPDERNAVRGGGGALEGRGALVTGGARDLGQTIARRLAGGGARVAITGPEAEDLHLTADALRALGTDAVGLPAQEGNITDLLRSCDEADRRMGGIDFLVNNARVAGGFATAGEIRLDGEGGFRESLQVYFNGAWMTSVHAALSMRLRGRQGCIVQVGSWYADKPYLLRSEFTVPKAMLQAASQALAQAMLPFSVSVVDVQPCLVEGPRLRWVADNYERHFRRLGFAEPREHAGLQEWFRRMIPKRPPTHTEAAEVVYLAASQGAFHTGRGLSVSTLPDEDDGEELYERSTERPSLKGGEALLFLGGAGAGDLQRARAMVEGWRSQGVTRVVILGSEEGRARWMETMRTGEGVEYRSVDLADEALVVAAVGELPPLVAAAWLSGSPRPGERFLEFPALPELALLPTDEREMRMRACGDAAHRFAEENVVRPVLALREGLGRLLPEAPFLVVGPGGRSPEGRVIQRALQQMVRIAHAEWALLGVGKPVVMARPPAAAARLSRWVVQQGQGLE